MSLLGKYTKGWRLRSSNPSFDPGQEIELFLTGVEGDTVVARVGDTKIRVPNASREYLDTRCRLRITEFDENNHVGEAEFVEKIGESAF